jgi:hypothetical protein
MEAIKLHGYVSKTKEGEWRLRISKSDVKNLEYGTIPSTNVLDKEEYKIYSFLTDLGIDINEIDNKYYHYRIEGDDKNIYCYGYTENCVRAGMVDILRKYNRSSKLSFTRSIEYNVYVNNNPKEEVNDVEGGFSNIFVTDLLPTGDY